MDDIVKQALAKWPNVPHCYGWLALDARGQWRMRDQRAQALNLSGDVIRHPALIDFINRNYLADERGCWYFQNGPQRVYVQLEASPYIARTSPEHGLLLHTGAPFPDPQMAWMNPSGQLFIGNQTLLALVDDRDLLPCLEQLRLDNAPVDDLQLLESLTQSTALPLQWRLPAPFQRDIPVHRAELLELWQRFGIIASPTPT